MEERHARVLGRFRELTARLADPALVADPQAYARLAREAAQLGEQGELAEALARAEAELEQARSLVREAGDDRDLRALAEEEVERLSERVRSLAEALDRALLPGGESEGGVVVEIRPGTGGEEGALFAGDLLRMYTRYAERRGWTAEVLALQETDLGGVKEAVLGVSGRGVRERLHLESGVHRVQRVPATEAQGRIHTSAATVAVLPEPTEVEVEIAPEDLKIDTFRSGGAGGQHVNKTESGVRITHLPTGITAVCTDERSQHKNREKAMRVLRARVHDALAQREAAKVAEARRSQVGSGDRSERIRTYNFPQGRVTDHRIGLTLYRLEAILDGDLDELTQALMEAERQARLGVAAGGDA
ncbi:MAG: peptide chain release factor 1 [Firmicutes bacterium]|nr:peptide chain release factor 1 [Bacillota bacterium]